MLLIEKEKQSKYQIILRIMTIILFITFLPAVLHSEPRRGTIVFHLPINTVVWDTAYNHFEIDPACLELKSPDISYSVRSAQFKDRDGIARSLRIGENEENYNLSVGNKTGKDNLDSTSGILRINEPKLIEHLMKYNVNDLSIYGPREEYLGNRWYRTDFITVTILINSEFIDELLGILKNENYILFADRASISPKLFKPIIRPGEKKNSVSGDLGRDDQDEHWNFNPHNVLWWDDMNLIIRDIDELGLVVDNEIVAITEENVIGGWHKVTQSDVRHNTIGLALASTINAGQWQQQYFDPGDPLDEEGVFKIYSNSQESTIILEDIVDCSNNTSQDYLNFVQDGLYQVTFRENTPYVNDDKFCDQWYLHAIDEDAPNNGNFFRTFNEIWRVNHSHWNYLGLRFNPHEPWEGDPIEVLFVEAWGLYDADGDYENEEHVWHRDLTGEGHGFIGSNGIIDVGEQFEYADYMHATGVLGVVRAGANDHWDLAGIAPCVDSFVFCPFKSANYWDSYSSISMFMLPRTESVICMTWNYDGGLTQQQLSDLEQLDRYVYCERIAEGAIIVCAACNRVYSGGSWHAGPYGPPASYDFTITIGATARDRTLPDYAPRVDVNNGERADYIDFCMPGGNSGFYYEAIPTLWHPQQDEGTVIGQHGTSFATPQAAGAAILAKCADFSMTQQRFKAEARGTAFMMDNQNGYHIGFGWGMINSNAILQYALSVDKDKPGEQLPRESEISVFPNPTNCDFNAKVKINVEGYYSLKVFDLMGRMTLHEHLGKLTTGDHTFTISTKLLSSGNYIVAITQKKEIKSYNLVTVVK